MRNGEMVVKIPVRFEITFLGLDYESSCIFYPKLFAFQLSCLLLV